MSVLLETKQKAEDVAYALSQVYQCELERGDAADYTEAERFFTVCADVLVELKMFPKGEGHRCFWAVWSMWQGWFGDHHADVHEPSYKVGARARVLYEAGKS